MKGNDAYSFNLFPDSKQLQSACIEFSTEECISKDDKVNEKYSIELTNYPKLGHKSTEKLAEVVVSWNLKSIKLKVDGKELERADYDDFKTDGKRIRFTIYVDRAQGRIAVLVND